MSGDTDVPYDSYTPFKALSVCIDNHIQKVLSQQGICIYFAP